MEKITIQDFNNSSKEFCSPNNCPLATAMKRILGRDDIRVGIAHIRTDKLKVLGTIIPHFGNEDYSRLHQGMEFEFEFTPYKLTEDEQDNN